MNHNNNNNNTNDNHNHNNNFLELWLNWNWSSVLYKSLTVDQISKREKQHHAHDDMCVHRKDTGFWNKRMSNGNVVPIPNPSNQQIYRQF